jgi:hypothetical protein
MQMMMTKMRTGMKDDEESEKRRMIEKKETIYLLS